MKRVFPLLLILILLVECLTTINTKAIQLKSYSNEVNVSIHLATSLTIKPNTAFQLVNKETGKSSIVPSNTTVTVKKESTSVTVSYTGFNEKSTKGFDMREISQSTEIVVSKKDTEIRRGASSAYSSVSTLKVGDSAVYLGSFYNSTAGQTWFNVASGSVKGWVLSNDVSKESFVTNPLTTVSNGRTYRGSFSLKPNGSQVELINILDMEDYLKGVVPSEMPASWHKEALKAQAIAARSYAANMMSLTSTAASQVYRGYSAEDPRSNAAVEETAGLVAKYNGKVIQTFFHSTSGGRTANVGDVWNSNQSSFPYLVSVEDPYEKSPYSTWEENFTADDILKSFGFPDNAQLYDVSLTVKGANGEIGSVSVKTSLGDKTVIGNENIIRKTFSIQSSAHYNMLYSNWFTMRVNKTQPDLSVQTSAGISSISSLNGQKVQTLNGQITLSDSIVSIQTSSGIVSISGSSGEVSTVTLSGKGWGHRIGMSQYGAKGMAEQGWKAEDIIKHYFKGTTVSK